MNLRLELEELQVELVKDFRKQLKEGEASSTDKSNMIKMFKDNGIFLKEEIGEDPFKNLLKLDVFKEIVLNKVEENKVEEDEVDEFLNAEIDFNDI